MKKMLIIILIPVFLLVISGIGVWVYLTFFFDENFVVQNIESNINARVELKKVKVGLFSLAPSFFCEGVSFAKRDGFADEGTRLNERPALKSPLISVKKMEFKANLLPLFKKQLVVQKFVANHADINMTINEDGENNLSPLFGPPPIVNGRPNPAFETKQKKSPETDNAGSTGSGRKFSSHDIPLSARINNIGLEQANINILVQHTRQRLQASGVDLMISSIDIDPNDLIKHNKANVLFDADFIVAGKDNREQAKLMIGSSGDIKPFDPRTGFINPRIVYMLRLKKGSFISSLIALDVINKTLPALSQIGLNMEKVTKRAELIKDSETGIVYREGRVSFIHDLSFTTLHYDMHIRKNSWINVINNRHEFKGNLVLSEEDSRKALEEVDGFIEKQAVSLAKRNIEMDVKKVRDQLLAGIVKDGRIDLGFSSRGNVKRPTVRLSILPSSLDSVLKKAVKDTFKSTIIKQVDESKIFKDITREQKDAAKKILEELLR
ncbi:MAG: hypothetical protein GY864_00865 [Desulfobacterales bacterium]|nr:hypothetical protein [Desulfobacterales bacterium]